MKDYISSKIEELKLNGFDDDYIIDYIKNKYNKAMNTIYQLILESTPELDSYEYREI